MALDLEHFNADPWDLNDIVPNDIEVICFHHFIPFLYFFSYFVHLALVLASTYLLLMILFLVFLCIPYCSFYSYLV